MANSYIMMDGSALTKERIENVEHKIQFYREFVKEGNISDAFYESDLSAFEEGIALLKERLGI